MWKLVRASHKLPGGPIHVMVATVKSVILFWKGRVENMGRQLVERRLIKNRTGTVTKKTEKQKTQQAESRRV